MEIETIRDALSGVFYLATSEDNQPHVRPFDGAATINSELYIGTNKSKDVYKQIEKNPKVEIFSMESGMVRFTAEAYPVNDEELNRETYEAIGKEYMDGSAAIKLQNIRGTYQDPMGEKTTFAINAEK